MYIPTTETDNRNHAVVATVDCAELRTMHGHCPSPSVLSIAHGPTPALPSAAPMKMQTLKLFMFLVFASICTNKVNGKEDSCVLFLSILHQDLLDCEHQKVETSYFMPS